MINIDFYTLFKKLLDLKDQFIHLEKNPASYYIEQEECTLNIYFDWTTIFPLKSHRKAWIALEPHLVRHILNPQTKTIILTGYSHGGIIAQLCYEYVKLVRPDITVIGIGYGSPRITHKKDFIIVRNGHDLSTYLSPIRSGKIFKIGRPWDTSYFISSVKKNGLWKAILNFDWFGPLKDHQSWRYEQALFRRFLLYCSRGHR